ncbi:MAG: coproporphyrinogen III oxidase family protein [Thermodesulfobacteriota bacterium]|nr:coproporphyrinogen III oxidase family protein [Thermodesulfobacteriota bacterium]
MIGKLITEVTKREFSRAMQFTEGVNASLPQGKTNHDMLLYLHIPFCESLCPYCSFNRILFDKDLCQRYHSALRKEIRLYKDKGYNFTSVYVGGGTPTIMMDELERTLLLAADCFNIREISVETNPNHLTQENVDILKKIGVNRLSVGVQSFDDGLLKAMGRYEKYGSGDMIAGRIAEISGQFDTLNADMIFNFPVQTEEILARDLDILINTGVDQVTYYPLMVSESTRRKVKRTLGIVDYRKEKKFYQLISKKLAPYYRFSSAWCFSRRGTMVDEYIVDYDEYAGLGSGSIGYMDGRSYANTFDIPQYIEMLGRGELPLMAARDFTPTQQARYDFLMKLFGLRLDASFLRKKYGGGGTWHLWREIFAFMLVGGLRYKRGTFYLTDRGRYYWVIMMREFFTAVNNFRDFCLGR